MHRQLSNFWCVYHTALHQYGSCHQVILRFTGEHAKAQWNFFGSSICLGSGMASSLIPLACMKLVEC